MDSDINGALFSLLGEFNIHNVLEQLIGMAKWHQDWSAEVEKKPGSPLRQGEGREGSGIHLPHRHRSWQPSLLRWRSEQLASFQSLSCSKTFRAIAGYHDHSVHSSILRVSYPSSLFSSGRDASPSMFNPLKLLQKTARPITEPYRSE